MNETTPRTADELIRAIAELMVTYHQASTGNVTATEENSLAMPAQASLPLKERLPSPWEGLTGVGPTTNMTPSAELSAKIQWLHVNLPGGISMRQLVLDATEKHVNQLIAEHYNGT